MIKYDDNIYGNLIVAAYRSTTFMENVKLEKNMILIVGDRHSIIEYAIKYIKAIFPSFLVAPFLAK